MRRILPATLLALAFVASAGIAQPAEKPYQGLGAGSVTPEIVARYAPKPLPAELTRHIQSLLDVRSPGGGILAPNGRQLYFSWNVTGISQVWRADAPLGFPVQTTGGEDATAIADITPDGKWLILERDRKGEENPGLYLQPAEGGALQAIQHLPGVRTFLQQVAPDSRSLLFKANDLKPDSYAIYRYDLQSRTRTTVFDQPGLWNVDDQRPDGLLLLAKSTGALSSEYSTYDPATRRLVPLFGQGEKEEYSASFGRHPGEVLVLTPKWGEFRRLYRFADGKFTPISPELRWDVETFTIDEKRTRILYQVNEAGWSRVHALDADTFAPIPGPDFAGVDGAEIGSTSRDGRVTIFRVQSAKAPSINVAYDWTTHALSEWTRPSAPEVDLGSFADATLESYPARDGTPIPMLVRRPKACPGPCPVVVSFHGGPEGQSRPGFSTTAQLFVDAGFVFVQPNVRGSDGYGKTWLHADDGPKRLQTITDIEDAALYIRQHWAQGGKAPKIGIYGGSYGGYSTLVGMTMFAGAYDAGVSIVGISNLESFLRNTAPYRRALRASEYGDPDKDREALRKLSPINYLDRVKAPLLLIQGVSDPRVPVGEALQIHDALAARGVPTELVLFPDEGHGARRRDNVVYQLGYTLRFLEEHLRERPPVAAPAN